jgi:hypothetical protein
VPNVPLDNSTQLPPEQFFAFAYRVTDSEPRPISIIGIVVVEVGYEMK